MADNPITTPLPADLPTDWVSGQTVGPQGTDVGLTQQHGYNYLMQQVNAAQQAATQIGQAFSGLSGESIPVSTTDAATISIALGEKADRGDSSIPETWMTIPVGKRLWFYTGGLNGYYIMNNGTNFGIYDHDSNCLLSLGYNSIPTVNNGIQVATLDDGGFLPVSSGGTGVGSLAALVSQLASNGVPSITTGSYVGDGNYGQSSPNSINTGNTSKFLIVTKDPPSFYSNNQPMEWFFWFPGITQVNVYSALADGDCAVSQSGATISWYNTDNASYQLNKSGTTYRWISFG